MSADMTMWSSEAWSSAADLYLLARSREGSAEAFGELWRRHLPAAYAVANRYRGRTAAEDIVAEASARVFSLIQDGKGPDEHFRAYFLSAVRTVAIDHGRRDLKVVPAEDQILEELGAPVVDEVGSELGGGPDNGFDADLIRTAFRGLSERDQRVLWHTTVEGSAPRTLAPALGMSANAVSAQAMRAREALRAQYLDACAARSLPAADSDECRWAIAHLGAHVRGRLPKRQKARVEEHLKTCDHATAVAADLRVIHAEFPALIVPFVFLAGLCTPGFVSAAAVAGLASGAAGAAVAGTTAAGGAAGGGATTGGAAGAGATAGGATTGGATAGGAAAGGTTAAGASAGGTSAAGAGAGASPTPTTALGAAASGAGGGAPITPPTSGASDVAGQLAGRATALVAGIAIGAGLANAAPVRVEPTVAARPAIVSPTTPTPSATTTQVLSPTVPPTSSPPPPRVTPPRPAPPVRTSAPVRTTAPVRTLAPSPKPTRTPRLPTSEQPPPPVKRVTPATASVHVVQQRESTRFLLRVRGVEGPITIVVSTPTGGQLDLHNSSWGCTSLGAAAIRCTGEDGQAMLVQSGLGGPADIRVVITDATGATRTQRLSLG